MFSILGSKYGPLIWALNALSLCKVRFEVWDLAGMWYVIGKERYWSMVSVCPTHDCFHLFPAVAVKCKGNNARRKLGSQCTGGGEMDARGAMTAKKRDTICCFALQLSRFATLNAGLVVSGAYVQRGSRAGRGHMQVDHQYDFEIIMLQVMLGIWDHYMGNYRDPNIEFNVV